MGCGLLLGWTGSMRALSVTDYGAVGDAVQFYVNTVSNSAVVTTTNQLSSADIGKSIEVFGVGARTFGKNSYNVTTYGNQDLIATITGVDNGTNITLSAIPQLTLGNTFATYGHNNSISFQNAINAATGPNTEIDIPAGVFLLLTRPITFTHGNGTFWADFVITNGGITLSGAGTNTTTLLGQGAWTIPSYYNPDGSTNSSVIRGVIMAISTPVANDYGLQVQNLTFDGGVQQGNIPVRGTYPNHVDGLGWDVSHDAICSFGGIGNTFTYQTFTNVSFQHWRGEIVKSTEGSTNGNVNIVNCAFYDGNATALNYYPSLFCSNNLFSGVSQIAEYYQAFYTNTAYFVDNICTNCSAGGFAINGGKGNNPPIYIENNTFYSVGDNTIMTTPGDNVFVISNQFISQAVSTLSTAIVLGALGYQGTYDNSNIVITANSFTGFNTVLVIGGGSSSTDEQRVENVWFTNNTSTAGSITAFEDYGWSTNVVFQNNYFGGDCTNGYPIFATEAAGAPCIQIPTNNIYWSGLRDPGGTTNILSYANGSRYQIWYSLAKNSVWALSVADSNQIPVGAQIMLDNENWSGTTANLYLNDSMTMGPIPIPSGQAPAFTWDGARWIPSGTPIIQASSGSVSLGTILSGAHTTGSFTVQNIGGGLLSGTASVAAPFTIVSGGTYNLTANQSQTVVVGFNPTTVGSLNQNVSLTGGGGTSINVYGIATSPPVPMIQATPGSFPFGGIPNGTSLTNSIIVQNVGSGTLSGTASVASPFRILSGGSYSLGAGQSQTVMVAFSPSTVGNYSQSVTLTGGGGTSVTVSGSSTTLPVIQITPANIAYGNIALGMSVTNSF
jgi:hypothetical protein